MLELSISAGVLVLFSTFATLGFVLRARLPEKHRSKESMDLIQLVMSLLVTFSALVLGLLTTSVKNDFDIAEHDRVEFAGQLTQLDQCMRNYGPGSETVRVQLQAYTAAIIASTWPSEPPPRGVTYPDVSEMARTGPNAALANLINDVGVEIRKLSPPDRFHQLTEGDCYDIYKIVLSKRWAVIDDVYSKMATPFFCAVVFWLSLVFAGFGLCAPPGRMTLAVIGLCTISVTSVLFIIEDMNTPYTGFFAITSTAMRAALAHMLAP